MPRAPACALRLNVHLTQRSRTAVHMGTGLDRARTVVCCLCRRYSRFTAQGVAPTIPVSRPSFPQPPRDSLVAAAVVCRLVDVEHNTSVLPEVAALRHGPPRKSAEPHLPGRIMTQDTRGRLRAVFRKNNSTQSGTTMTFYKPAVLCLSTTRLQRCRNVVYHAQTIENLLCDTNCTSPVREEFARVSFLRKRLGKVLGLLKLFVVVLDQCT